MYFSRSNVPSPKAAIASRRQVAMASPTPGAIAALVNERGDALYVHGRSGHYLELAPGEAVMNILTMAREGLRRDLTTALHKAIAQKQPVRHEGLLVKTNGGFSRVNLTVRPAEAGPNAVAEPGLFVVILEDAPDRTPAPTVAAPLLGHVQLYLPDFFSRFPIHGKEIPIIVAKINNPLMHNG
jgi:hypothetical protein